MGGCGAGAGGVGWVVCGGTTSPGTVSLAAALGRASLPSFSISETSDLKMRIERPTLRAASGSFFQPKRITSSTATMIRWLG